MQPYTRNNVLIRIILFLFFLSNVLFVLASAEQKADSVYNTFAHLNDTAKIIEIVDFVTKNPVAINDGKLSLNLLQRVKDLAVSKNFKRFLPRIDKTMGRVYFNLSEYKKANEIFLQMLEHESSSDEFLVDKCDIYNFLGLIQRSLGNYELSIKYFFQSLEIAEQLKSDDKIAVAHTNIGGIYYYQDKFKDAVASFEEAKKYRIKLHDSAGVAGLENNMGALLLEEKNFKEALKNFKQAYSYYERMKLARYQALILNNIARCYIGLKQNADALNYLHLALLYAQKSGHKSAVINSNYLIGDIYQAQHKLLDAMLYYKKSLDLAREEQLKPLIRDLYKKMAETENSLKNFSNAYHYHTLYALYQDSIINENTNKQIAEIQEKYESEKKEKEIESLSKEKLLQEIEITKKKNELNTQKNIRNYSFIGLGILSLLLFLLYINFSNKKKNAKILEEKNKEIEAKNKDITDSIQYASRIQNAILPAISDFKKFFPNSFVLYKPKDIVAGDFYWLEQKNNSIFVAAADCTGHGVPGAMVSVVCSNALNRAIHEFGITSPSKILDKTRELVIEHFSKSDTEVKDGMDISLCKLEKTENRKYLMEWAGANNALWLCRKCDTKNNEIQESEKMFTSVVDNTYFKLLEVAADKQPIGNFVNIKPFTNYSIELLADDTIYLFTDGFADQFGGEKGKKMKSSNFKKLLLSVQHENMKKQHEMLTDAFVKWKGNFVQVDDVCIIGLRV